MSTTILQFLDIAFFVFHLAVIAGNLTGWIWKRTRVAHRVVLGVTAFSWFGLGPLLGYPPGYCFCTDAHWRIRRQLGVTNDPNGYIQLLFQMAGMPISGDTATALAYGAFALALIATIVIVVIERIRARRAARTGPVSDHAFTCGH
jgi:ABC-type Mn2+/Zn2+ transport system permease subunit